MIGPANGKAPLPDGLVQARIIQARIQNAVSEGLKRGVQKAPVLLGATVIPPRDAEARDIGPVIDRALDRAYWQLVLLIVARGLRIEDGEIVPADPVITPQGVQIGLLWYGRGHDERIPLRLREDSRIVT